ncbi:unnamed protein product [Ceutorhynchus assimilis]|uniref:Peptidase S1 domain-containing protein n=1 Tax=Ceutorhynchus assimilis TaxID=467358 RepID=A0A9N9MKJ8_9CUCU|nr:unnamed protein product [Ceutorhynchus assimilis]
MLFKILCVIVLNLPRNAKGVLGIVGGQNATDGEFPYMVSLRGENQLHYCGGSIIGSKWILTAGHCTSFAVFIRYGSVFLDDGGGENTVKVKNQILHPLWYTDLIPYNDLGLLELEEALIFDNNIQPIKLPENFEAIPFNVTAILTGWGFMENDTQTDILQKVDLILFDDNYCDLELNQDGNFFNSSLNTCAGDWEHEKGQCTMDSGGPLTINGTQWGIVSWSYKPCGILPGAFTRLANSNYREWIRNVTGI